MDLFSAYGSLGEVALLAGLSATRVAVAFILLPIFAPETVPAMVRSAIFLALGALSLALQPAFPPANLGGAQWLLLFGREAVLGLGLGFGLAALLWAFEAAGSIIDTKVAVANGQIADPMAGQTLTPSATMLGRLASFLFMAGGGFMLFVGVLIESFRVWPLAQPGFTPRLGAVRLFEQHFGDLMLLALLLAAPVLVVMFAIDLALGLVNRFAPQLNLISLSMSLKQLAAIAIWLVVLGNLVQAFGDELARRLADVLPGLERAFGR
jgi:type III secretion protein T